MYVLNFKRLTTQSTLYKKIIITLYITIYPSSLNFKGNHRPHCRTAMLSASAAAASSLVGLVRTTGGDAWTGAAAGDLIINFKAKGLH